MLSKEQLTDSSKMMSVEAQTARQDRAGDRVPQNLQVSFEGLCADWSSLVGLPRTSRQCPFGCLPGGIDQM